MSFMSFPSVELHKKRTPQQEAGASPESSA
jgi:hypothetical protein